MARDYLSIVSPKAAKSPSVQQLAQTTNRLAKSNATKASKISALSKATSLVGITVPTQIGAFGGGALDQLAPSVMGQPARRVAAVALVLLGMGSPAALHAANGLLAPDAYTEGRRRAAQWAAARSEA